MTALARRSRLAALATAIALGACGPAPAQTIAARCQGMKDQIGCVCALETGGTSSGKTWARGPDRAAYEACVTDRGGTIGQKPAKIPSRL